MLVDLLVRGAVVVALVLLLLTGFMYVTQRGSLYFPWGGLVEPAPPGVEAVELATDDGLRLAAWFVRAAGRGGQPGPAVLVCNGNAGYRAHRFPLAQALAEQGYHVLLFDYRGYAGNPGTPAEDGLRTDARAAARALAGRAEVDADRVAYFGESLGASVCSGLATELPPAALILRWPFPSTVEVGRHHYPYLPYRRAARLGSVAAGAAAGSRGACAAAHRGWGAGRGGAAASVSRRAYEAAGSESKRLGRGLRRH